MGFVARSGLSCLGRSGSSIRRGTGCSATTGGSCWGECGGVLRAVRRWDKDWEEGVGAGRGGGSIAGVVAVVFTIFTINLLTNERMFGRLFLCSRRKTSTRQPSTTCVGSA